MISYVDLPNPEKPRRLSFYLAMEEHVARRLPAADYFFEWRVEPSVIFGRNQLIENEVNVDYCRSAGIEMYRRKSGGGCVYSDMGNVMMSYITPGDDTISDVFGRYLSTVTAMLRSLGVDARATGRNDITIGGRKVSGNAFYRIPSRSVVHGTMLYDTHVANMARSITPAGEKLRSKGVESVRQRITLLKEHISMPLDSFMGYVRQRMCQRSTRLDEADLDAIEDIEREYLSPEFIFGRNPRYNVTRRRRIDGVGEIEARIELKNGKIMSINMVGDYFLTGDIDGELLKPLVGVRLDAGALAAAIPADTSRIVANLSKNDLVALLTGRE